MPDANSKKPLYNLEARLRALGNLDNSFIVGIFDCCRDAFDQSIFPPAVTKGIVGKQNTEVETEKGRNVFLIFGCPSNKSVPATSKIATQFFEIIQQAKAENECILLPDAANFFNAWTPNFQEAENGEKILIMSKPLHMFGPFPQSPQSESAAVKGASQVFDYSRMEGRFFKPDVKICFIVCNEHYDKLRKLPEFAQKHEFGSLVNKLQYPDMPRAREWADEFEQGIKEYGIFPVQIRRYNDADIDTIFSAIWNARYRIGDNAELGLRTLLLFFYAGYGVSVRGNTSALFNSDIRSYEINQRHLE